MAATENHTNLNQACKQHIVTVTSQINSGTYNVKVYEDIEATVAVEGPMNKRRLDIPEIHNFVSAAGGPDINEDLAPENEQEHSANDESINVDDLPCTIKPEECHLIRILQNFLRNPNTWRIVKGALAIIFLWKFYSAVGIIEEYIPECLNFETFKTFLGWHYFSSAINFNI